MYCHNYKRAQRNPAVWKQCKVEAFTQITVRDKATGDVVTMPVCDECLKTLSNDTDYEILEKVAQ